MFSNGNSDTYRQDNTAGYNRIGPQSPAHAAHLCKECEDSTISRSNKLFSSAHRHAIRLAPVPIEVL
jgi:hypothetical protein